MKKHTYTTNQTKLKIICYYSHRKDGTPYTAHEIKQKLNRHTHDIFEFIYGTGNKVIIREDLSIKKILRHLELYKDFINTMLIIVNSYKLNQELRIGLYTRLGGLKFTHPEIKTDANGNKVLSKLTVLKRDAMQTRTLNLNRYAA